MDQDQVAISRLVKLPTVWGQRGDVSVIDLIGAWEIREAYELGTLTKAAIVEHLRSNRSLIDNWRGWSEDKRCGGAYFDRTQDGRYTVAANLDARAKQFKTAEDACAEFILLELRSWLR